MDSVLPEANEITRGKPIHFKDGRPDFSEWSEGGIEFNIGDLDGTKSDFDLVYEKLFMDGDIGVNSKTGAKDWLSNNGITPHHFSDITIQLIPTKLHGNVPHIGSASDMRNK